MKAMILAAGRGERLLPLTESIPKPLIPISSEPIIVHQIRWLHRAGIKEIVINLYHLSDQITKHLGNGGDLGVRIQYVHENTLLDTGGAVKNALPLLGDEPFLVLNGDIWTNFPFRQLTSIRPKAAHLVLENKPMNRIHGDFYLEEEFVRRGTDETNSLVFSGIAVVSSNAFSKSSKRVFSIAKDVYFPLSKDNMITGEMFDGTWFDIGTHEQLKAVRRIYL